MMYHLTGYTQWTIAVFSFFCLVQVRNLFEDILQYLYEQQNNFTWQGRRYSIMPNRSFILDDSLKAYGLDVQYRHRLN